MIEFSYVHIPFCAKKCKYCAFTSFVNSGKIQEYIEALLFEIEKRYDGAPQRGLYIGGGTPSLLELNQIGAILKKFNLNGEITLEVNPENATIDYFSRLLDFGVNRLSIGAQSFDDKVLIETGRRHSAKEAALAVEKAYKAGFSNVSIDLIYGLAKQDFNSWEKTLKMAKSLDLQHISLYGLKIEEGSYYGKFPPETVPDEEEQADMYEAALEILGNYLRYEISNFAKNKNFISAHNLNYWNQGQYRGFGLGACGFEGNVRYKNTTKIQKYLTDPLLREEEDILSREQLLEEAIFLGFRREWGIYTLEINSKFKIDFDKKYEKIISKYLKSGHILKTPNGYKLSTAGVLISNYILCDFLC